MRNLAAVLSFLLAAPPAPAAVRAGDVAFAETVRMGAEGPELVLNGAGVRHKLFLRIYAAALYLPQPVRDAHAVMARDLPARVVMHFLSPKVSAEKITAAWTRGFEANQPPARLQALRSRLERFNALFPSVRRGDEIRIDYLPESGTAVHLNGRLLGTVPGEDFFHALLAVWLGSHPADAGLKEALLGRDRP